MASDKKRKNKQKNDKIKSKLKQILYNNLWKVCLVIAICDLGHALFFVFNATISLVTRQFNIYSILALLGTIFWMLIVLLLLVGLLKPRPVFVRIWLIFSIFGFIVDLCFLIWGLVSSVSIDWDNFNEFSIIFVGIFVEIACIYLVHKYYIAMDPCRYVYHSKADKAKNKKRHMDEKECKKSQKKSSKKTKTKSKKKSKK